MNAMPAAFVTLLCGIIFLVAAVIMLAFPPRKINDLYGYRTANSKKSQAHWDFAQRYSSWRMIEAALFMLLFTIVFQDAQWPDAEMLIGLGILVLATVYMLACTEVALKRKFPNT